MCSRIPVKKIHDYGRVFLDLFKYEKLSYNYKIIDIYARKKNEITRVYEYFFNTKI